MTHPSSTVPMSSLLRAWAAPRVARFLDRVASAFVTETVTDDGTRVLMALDPSCHGLDLVLVTSDQVTDRTDTPAPDHSSWDRWQAPDDIRSIA